MTKNRKRRKHSDKFKAKVALEAIRGVKTLAHRAPVKNYSPTIKSSEDCGRRREWDENWSVCLR